MASTHPSGGRWSRDNFILGSRLQQSLYWSGSCCHLLKLEVTDVAGLKTECGLGGQTSSRNLVFGLSLSAASLTLLLLAAVLGLLLLRSGSEHSRVLSGLMRIVFAGEDVRQSWRR